MKTPSTSSLTTLFYPTPAEMLEAAYALLREAATLPASVRQSGYFATSLWRAVPANSRYQLLYLNPPFRVGCETAYPHRMHRQTGGVQ